MRAPQAGIENQVLSAPEVDSAQNQVLPLDDGRVLLCRTARRGPSQETSQETSHEILLAAPNSAPRRLATSTTPGLRLVGHPDEGELGLALTTSADGDSTAWRLRHDEPSLVRITTISGLTAGGQWLDRTGRRLAVTRAWRGRVDTVVIDVDTGLVERLWPEPGHRLLLSAPASGTWIVGHGTDRIGWMRAEDAQPRWPDPWAELPDIVPLAVDPSGARLACRVDDGARSGLVVVQLDRERVRRVPLPDGTVGAVAGWTDDGLHVPFAGPSQPPCLARVDVGTGAVTALDRSANGRSAPLRGAAGHATPRVERFDTSHGQVEAVSYGDWRTSRQVVLALHGGPDAAWNIAPVELLARLAAQDTAVVAVNPRGSGGYGSANASAIHGCWGGPDLADVRAVAATVRAAQNRPLALLGSSYGGFLGLLTLAADPKLWSHAVLVAPFSSGPGLYAEAGPLVRALLERLGGTTVHHDHELGPRDVLAVGHRIAAEVWLMHGRHDAVIPVGHVRAIHQRLRGVGIRTHYRELPDSDHDPLSAADAGPVRQQVIDFLTGPVLVPPETGGRVSHSPSGQETLPDHDRMKGGEPDDESDRRHRGSRAAARD